MAHGEPADCSQALGNQPLPALPRDPPTRSSELLANLSPVHTKEVVMKKIRFILAAVLVVAQVPFTALALPAASSGPTLLSQEVLNSVTGGACTSCHTTPAPEPEE